MKITKLFLGIFVFIFFVISVYAQEETAIEAPPGMEVKKVGNMNLLIPKGAKVSKKGSLIIVESMTEYSSRKFTELEQRLEELEVKEAELKEEVKILKAALEELSQNKQPPAIEEE